MIVFRNIDGTLEAEPEHPRGAMPSRIHRVDREAEEEIERAGTLASVFAPPFDRVMYTRSYDRVRTIYRPGRDGSGGAPVVLYVEVTPPSEMAAGVVGARLGRAEAEIARLHGDAAKLRSVAHRPTPTMTARAVARDAWLEGRLADARTILLQAMTEEQALATVQQWTAEEWRALAGSKAT